MPPYISPMFSNFSRKSNQFYEAELQDFLCPQPFRGDKPLSVPLSLNSGLTMEEAKGKYEFHLSKSADGRTITLDATLTRDGKTYKTGMTAVRVSENLYELTQLTFDNKIERLDARWEMSKVLAHIGKEQLQKACRGELPQAHEERGKFGKLARFADRWLLPDNPYIVPPGI